MNWSRAIFPSLKRRGGCAEQSEAQTGWSARRYGSAEPTTAARQPAGCRATPPFQGGECCLIPKVLIFCWALCLLCCFDLSASAETRGQVAFGGVPVPGATVTASQGEKNFVAITDLMGMYVLPDLTEGMWT